MMKFALVSIVASSCLLAVTVAGAQEAPPVPEKVAAPVPVVVPAPEQLAARLVKVLDAAPLGLKLGDKTTCQLAGSVSGVQFNLKTGDYKRVALMGGYGCTYRGKVPVGVAGYVGVGISKEDPNALQFNLMFNVFDLGAAGPGVQVYKDRTGADRYVFQGLFTVALNMNVGGTVSKLREIVSEAAAE